MHCQSPHEAALGEMALPDRPAICYSSFHEGSDSLQWTVRFQCSSSAGMSEKVAAKLDGILQQLKCSGTATISSEVQRENRTELNYHIEF